VIIILFQMFSVILISYSKFQTIVTIP